jgi:UDP-N-acetylenolpyruvoylglucosamine reductase
LFDDRGFDGCIILNCINFVEVLDSGVYRVGSGHAFNILGMLCSRDGFSGLEFASGIPGTVGGAIFMNAGADGQVCVSLGFSRLVCLGKYQHKEEFCFPAGDFYKMVVACLRASC